jgi:hypothetical protein
VCRGYSRDHDITNLSVKKNTPSKRYLGHIWFVGSFGFKAYICIRVIRFIISIIRIMMIGWVSRFISKLI